jgi:hypothetical protein
MDRAGGGNIVGSLLFYSWVVIESRNITVSGIDASGTNYSKPGYFHFFLTAFFLFFNFMPRLWAKRANLPVLALNLGWAVRNFLIITACQGGECPVKKSGIWLVLLASGLMLVSGLFPGMKLKKNKNGN